MDSALVQPLISLGSAKVVHDLSMPVHGTSRRALPILQPVRAATGLA